MIDRVRALFLLVGPALSLVACGAGPARPPEVVVATPGATGDAAAAGAPKAGADASKKVDASQKQADAPQAKTTELAELEVMMVGALSTSGAPTTGVLTGPSGGSADANATGPAAVANISLEGKSGGAVANAEAVLAAMSAGMRRCYSAALAKDPASPAGVMDLEASVGTNGEVSSVVAKNTTKAASWVQSCVKARIAAAQFAAPDSGAAKLQIRVAVDRAP